MNSGVTAAVDEPVLTRRALVAAVALAATTGGRPRAAEAPATAVKAAPTERVRVAVMGVNNRGAALAKGFAAVG